MSKRVFLYVTGEDYASLTFERNYDPQDVYETMVRNEEKYTNFDDYDSEIDVEVVKFGDIDDRFIEFVFNNLVDSDDAKSINIFEVKEV